jgi:hypothetical protein
MVNKFLTCRLMKRRALVITDDAARHPFLASLPPHVRRERGLMINRQKTSTGVSSVREFLMTYCACFAAVAVFIA